MSTSLTFSSHWICSPSHSAMNWLVSSVGSVPGVSCRAAATSRKISSKVEAAQP